MHKKEFTFITSLLFCSYACAYAPSYISGKYYTAGMRNGIYAKHWMLGMQEQYNTNPLKFLVPGVMVDNQGDLYTADEVNFATNGYYIRVQKRKTDNSTSSFSFYPWREIFSTHKFTEGNYPKYINDASALNKILRKGVFQQHVHNLFQYSFAHELDGVVSDYIYLIAYIAPSTYEDNQVDDPEKEGLMIFKIRKSDLAIVKKRLITAKYSLGSGSSSLLYGYTPRLSSTSYIKFNLQEGKCHACFDGEYVTIHYFYHPQDEDDKTLARHAYFRIDISDLSWTTSGGFGDLDTIGGAQIVPRFQKMDNKIYFVKIHGGFYYTLMYQRSPFTFSLLQNSLFETYEEIFPSRWLCTTSQGSCAHTVFHADFCVVKSDSGVPIWCLLYFNSKGLRTNCTAQYYWDSTYMNWNPSHVTLCLASYPINGNAFLYTKTQADTDTAIVYPSDALYSTTLPQNNNSIATEEDTSKTDLYRIYLNSHKIVPYTSPTGRKYFIYAYCYPGKKTHLYIGYCAYRIDSSNFVHLGTQTVLKAPDTEGNWGDSFLTDCSRIISFNLKNDHLWITWMSVDDTTHYCFHIKASDLIPE